MWIRAMAIGVVAMLLIVPLATVPNAVPVLVTIAGVSFAIAVVSKIRIRDRYDLDLLREVHEAEELRDINEQIFVSEDAGVVVCVHCMTEYKPRLGVCPRCGQRG